MKEHIHGMKLGGKNIITLHLDDINTTTINQLEDMIKKTTGISNFYLYYNGKHINVEGKNQLSLGVYGVMKERYIQVRPI